MACFFRGGGKKCSTFFHYFLIAEVFVAFFFQQFWCNFFKIVILNNLCRSFPFFIICCQLLFILEILGSYFLRIMPISRGRSYQGARQLTIETVKGITKFVWQLGRYLPSCPSTKKRHDRINKNCGIRFPISTLNEWVFKELAQS